MTSQGARAASARAFVHSLNILIKYARMYGYEHKRTEAQFETTWKELQQGLPTTGDAGFLLGVSDNKLLLDGIPLEAGNAEKSFATLLSTAGLASLHQRGNFLAAFDDVDQDGIRRQIVVPKLMMNRLEIPF